jgi:G:T-mismatch repair DNA endonuclease (very short patch repair protein)
MYSLIKQQQYGIKKSHKKYQNKIMNEDYVICQICNFYAACLAGHLISHNISAEKYRNQFKCETASTNYKNKLAERFKGEKNPGYQHGGKLSSLSENFIHKTDTSREDTLRNIKKSKKENPQNETTKIEYYTSRGFSEQEAKNALKNRQTTFSLEKCIEKHGEEKGKEVWLERRNKWQLTLNNKSDEEKANISRKKVSIGSISKAEKEIFNIMNTYFHDVKQRYCLVDSKISFVYDIKFKNKIIEYNGDYWHANPKIYTENFFNKSNKKFAHELWLRDKLKKELAENKGFDVLIIWESDYKNDKEGTIKKCINFLTQ